MRLNGYELNEVYDFKVINVNFLKENIFAVILLQLSEARSFHHRWGATAWARTLYEGCLCKCSMGWRAGGPAVIYINISLMWVIAWIYNEAVMGSSLLWFHSFHKHKQTVSLLCLQASHVEYHGLLLSLHLHSKYTDHCARLRKQGLCILAGGIYAGKATNPLYLVFDGWGSREDQGLPL